MFRNLSGGFTFKINSAIRHVRNIGLRNLVPPPPPIQLCESMAPYRTGTTDKGFVWTSRYGKIIDSDLTVEEYVWNNVGKWQDKIAIVCGITGRKFSYGNLRDQCAVAAYRLRTDFKLQRGDVVAISMSNISEYAIVALGALEAGLQLTMINPLYTAGLLNDIVVK